MRTRKKIAQVVQSESAVPGGRELRLTYRAGDGSPVPSILLLPPGEGPHAATLLVHGYSSRKDEMAGPVGLALLARGVASLSIDLPMHGTRKDPLQLQTSRNPLAILQLWKQSLADARLGIQYLAARPEVARDRVGIVGYSLGSFLAVALAAEEPKVKAVALAAGGDLPEGTPLARVARLAADPMSAVKKLDGRPLLMVHGRHDETVRPAQAERLFAAAEKPKELRWFDAGHRLPPSAIDDVADWMAARLVETEVRGRTG